MSFFRALWSIFGQSQLIPSPSVTPKSVPSQSGRVHVVTGGYSGVGLELVKLLLECDATVVIAGRRRAAFDQAALELMRMFPRLTVPPPPSSSSVEPAGRADMLAASASYTPSLLSSSETGPVLHFTQIDLGDIESVNKAADDIISRMPRLDVLTNNAGIMNTKPTETTKDGHEQQLGTNVLGPFVLSHRLADLLFKTAQRDDVEEGDVRVTWAGSLVVDMADLLPDIFQAWDVEVSKPEARSAPSTSPQEGSTGPVTGLTEMGPSTLNYQRSKIGNVYLAASFSSRFENMARQSTGSRSGSARRVLSVGWNPGNLQSDLFKTTPGLIRWITSAVVLYPVSLGGHTEFFAACARPVATTALSKSQAGTGWTNHYGATGAVYVRPWGRIASSLPDGLERGIGEGKHERLYRWCLDQSGLEDRTW